MSYETLVAEFPAYKVFKREVRMCGSGYSHQMKPATKIEYGEQLGLKKKGYYQTFTPGSVVSYALESGYCPIEEYAKSKAKGHKLYWLNQDAVSITAWERPQEKLIEIEVGMTVYFEGHFFKIVSAPNGNLNLVEVVEETTKEAM